MTTATTPLPFTVAGFPLRSWAFAVRIWIAAVVALLVSFWLQLENPSSAMLTIMILAEPTRGQALEKAGYRLVATTIGVVASIVIVGALSQTRDLLIVAFAAWMGLCICACYLFDGYRAYAAVLSGYTVALIAIQQIDKPQNVFDTAMERGAAIAVGVLSIMLVNDLLLAPDRHPQIGAQLAALHARARNYARSVIRGEATDAVTVAMLIREIVALRPDISSLVTESSSGPVRSAAARSAMVALVAEVQAIRTLTALPAISDTSLRERCTRLFEPDAEQLLHDMPGSTSTSLMWALGELRRRDAEVSTHLSALQSVVRPPRPWRAPLYRSGRIAIENGMRAAACVLAASLFFVLAGWPSASSAFSLVAVVLGLGATTPAPRAFTALGFIATPIAITLTGILEFFVLNGASDFPLLALGLAPFLIGAALFVTLPNPTLSGLGKVNLIYMSAILALTNPYAYNPQAFLFTSFFVYLAAAVLLAAQYLVPPVTVEQRRRWLLASAHDDLFQMPNRADQREAPEEAAFRDAMRVGQIAAAGPGDANYRYSVEQALVYFDQATAIRCGVARLARLMDRTAIEPAEQARVALSARDPELIRAAADNLGRRAAAGGELATASVALTVAGAVIRGAAVGTNQGEKL